MVLVYVYKCDESVGCLVFGRGVGVTLGEGIGDGRNSSGGFSRRPDSRAADRSGLQHPRLSAVSYMHIKLLPHRTRIFRAALISRVGQTIRRP
jgi:hypothetical protein